MTLICRSQAIAVDSPGKSGAKFYQSYDKLFIIKSLTREEVERMHSFLKHYHPVSDQLRINSLIYGVAFEFE